jgi:uncharacterized protein YjbI with pentapeptide repeats
VTTRPPRDWIQISVTALPGLAAVIALIFTWVSINATTNTTNHQLNATNHQLQISEQGQFTDRYNAAITNLGSPSVDVRLGGIYALQRIMQDSPRDQPTAVAVLCAFVRDHANPVTAKSARAALRPPTDVQAAATVVGTRDPHHDGSTTVVNLHGADLSGADLSGARLTGADLTAVHLHGANLYGADLGGARLSSADLTWAQFTRAKLTGAYLDANLAYASLNDANLTGAEFGSGGWGFTGSRANLNHASLAIANLTGAYLHSADLTGAFLPGAKLPGAELSGANLTGAVLFHANLTGADFSGANLTGADLSGANRSGATFTGAKGLRIGTPQPSPGSTPASANNLRRQVIATLPRCFSRSGVRARGAGDHRGAGQAMAVRITGGLMASSISAHTAEFRPHAAADAAS